MRITPGRFCWAKDRGCSLFGVKSCQGNVREAVSPPRATEDVEAQANGTVHGEAHRHRNVGGTLPAPSSVQAPVCLALREALAMPRGLRLGAPSRAFHSNVLLMTGPGTRHKESTLQ